MHRLLPCQGRGGENEPHCYSIFTKDATFLFVSGSC